LPSDSGGGTAARLRPGSGRAAAGIPGRATAGIPGRATAGIPGRATARIPGRATAGIPGRATAGIPGRAAAGIPGRNAAGIPGRAAAELRLSRRRIRDWDRTGFGRVAARRPREPALPQVELAVNLRRRSVSARRRGGPGVTRSNNLINSHTGQIVITSPKDSRIYVRAAWQPC